MANLSLWLMPEKSASERFQRQIDALSKRYSGPAFVPHVTLVSRLTASRDAIDTIIQATLYSDKLSASNAADKHQGLEAHPCGFDCEDLYWRFLYIKLDRSAELMQLHEQLCEAFSINADNFTPHLSLMYAEPDRRRFESICAELSGSLMQPFRLAEMALIDLGTAGDPTEWQVLKYYPLSAQV